MLPAVTRRRRRFRLRTTVGAQDTAQIRALYFEQLWAVEDVASELDLTEQAVIVAIRAMGEAPLAADPSTHVHVWEPAPDLEFWKYRCACGRTAHRTRTLEIVPDRGLLRLFRERSDRHNSGGRLPKMPTLDDYDRTPG